MAGVPAVNGAMCGRGEQSSRCAECGNLLTDALVLSCGHDLCLSCAANALRQTRSLSGRMVRCLLCPSVTELCEEAAAALGGKTYAPATASSIPAGAPIAPDDAPLYPQLQATIGATANGPCGGASHFAEPTVCAFSVSGANNCMAQPGFPAGLPFRKLQPPRPGGMHNNAYLRQRGHADAAAAGDSAPASLEGSCKGRSASSSLPRRAVQPVVVPITPVGTPRDTAISEAQPLRNGSMLHVARPGSHDFIGCPEHPDEPATYFCARCECACICAECVVQKDGRHRDHEVMRTGRAHEALRARAGALIDEAVALEDDFAMVADRLAWRRKDVERAAARGRASVRSAFARVRAQLTDRETELLESLDLYESDSLMRLDRGTYEHTNRLSELRRLQESLRTRCRNGADAVEALNTYAAAKAAIGSLRESFRQDDTSTAVPPDEFVGLAGSARAELDLHAEGLERLEEAVANLCERGVDFTTVARPGGDRRGEAPTVMGPRERGNADAVSHDSMPAWSRASGGGLSGEAPPAAPMFHHGQQQQHHQGSIDGRITPPIPFRTSRGAVA